MFIELKRSGLPPFSSFPSKLDHPTVDHMDPFCWDDYSPLLSLQDVHELSMWSRQAVDFCGLNAQLSITVLFCFYWEVRMKGVIFFTMYITVVLEITLSEIRMRQDQDLKNQFCKPWQSCTVKEHSLYYLVFCWKHLTDKNCLPSRKCKILKSLRVCYTTFLQRN